MKICLDLSPVVHRKAGLGTYAGELAARLVSMNTGHTFSAFQYGTMAEAALPPSLSALPRRSVPWGARRWRLSVAFAYLAGQAMDARLPETDLFHATEHLLPPFRSIRTVFTFHDAIYALFPQYHLPLNRLYLGLMMPRFLARADAVIAVSECSKRDAARLYGLDPERVRVIYEGVDPRLHPLDPETLAAERRRLRAAYALPERYLLYLGTIEPRKNLLTLLDAYHALAQQGDAPGLVIAGRKGWLYEPVPARVRALGLEDQVFFTGWVPDADALALLNAAECFVFPSLYEGFGLPVLEAMACGAPVISSDAASLPEVVGDAGLLVSPVDAAALAGAIRRVLTEEALRAELRARGLAQAARFTWERAARETLRVYEQAASTRQ